MPVSSDTRTLISLATGATPMYLPLVVVSLRYQHSLAILREQLKHRSSERRAIRAQPRSLRISAEEAAQVPQPD